MVHFGAKVKFGMRSISVGPGTMVLGRSDFLGLNRTPGNP